jgi:hypothetical protein
MQRYAFGLFWPCIHRLQPIAKLFEPFAQRFGCLLQFLQRRSRLWIMTDDTTAFAAGASWFFAVTSMSEDEEGEEKE